jgi:type IV pilus assembly protein PilB
MSRKKLGEMLIEAGVLDETGLRQALNDQRRWGRTLGRTLVELGLVDEDTLVAVLAKQLGIQSVDLGDYDVPPRVLDLVPAELARQHHLVPFAQPMKFLDVAMSDPTNLGVVDELRIRTQLNIRPYLAGPRQLERAIGHYYGLGLGARPEVMVHLDTPDTFEVEPELRSATTMRARRPSRGPLADPSPDVAAAIARATTSRADLRDAEVAALQDRISKLEALVERDEQVLRGLLSLLIDKGIATRDEILARLG